MIRKEGSDMKSPSKDWLDWICAAQQERTYTIMGVEFARLPWGADQKPCRDCGVVKGQLHVPGCTAETCPACHGQAFACDCPAVDNPSNEIDQLRKLVADLLFEADANPAGPVWHWVEHGQCAALLARYRRLFKAADGVPVSGPKRVVTSW